jgi:hypothetical protein
MHAWLERLAAAPPREEGHGRGHEEAETRSEDSNWLAYWKETCVMGENGSSSGLDWVGS